MAGWSWMVGIVASIIGGSRLVPWATSPRIDQA
jgi:hypothetical protein